MNTNTAADSLNSRGAWVRENLVRRIANEAMGQDDIIALWFGEPDQPTPSFICDAAVRAMQSGDTFYTESLGRPFLRQAIAKYQSELLASEISADRIAVTVSGGNALNLAFQALLNEGDKVVTTTPSFPNLLSIPALQGAQVKTVRLLPTQGGWQLDLEQLLTAAQDAKVVLINSPNNPTGWVMPNEDLKTLGSVSKRLSRVF